MINLGPYSGKNCPNVRYSPNIIDRVLEGAALLVLLVIWGNIYWLYTQKAGVLSSSVWITGGMSVLIFCIMEFCSYAPVRWINFPVPVSERNIAVQYMLAVRFTRVVNIDICLMFLSATFLDYYWMARVFFGISLGLLAISFIIYYIMAFKYK